MTENSYRFSLKHSQSPPRIIEGHVSYKPSGTCMKLKVWGKSPARYVQSSEVDEVMQLDTGEIFSDPTNFFRQKYVVDIAEINNGIIPLEVFIDLIPINGLGGLRANIIARYFGSFDNFANEIRLCLSGHYRENDSQLSSLFMIGPAQYQKIIDFFSQPDAWKIINDITYGFEIGTKTNAQITSQLYDKSIVFTGTLSSVSRPEAKAIAENAGAKVCGSISKFIDYVVVGQEAGSKLKQAQALDLTILTEKEFLTLVGRSV